MFRRLIASFFVLVFAAAVSGCGDTWEGAKEDTSDNLKSTGKALDKAGDKVED
jgi:predicted small secreted protein